MEFGGNWITIGCDMYLVFPVIWFKLPQWVCNLCWERNPVNLSGSCYPNYRKQIMACIRQFRTAQPINSWQTVTCWRSVLFSKTCPPELQTCACATISSSSLLDEIAIEKGETCRHKTFFLWHPNPSFLLPAQYTNRNACECDDMRVT